MEDLIGHEISHEFINKQEVKQVHNSKAIKRKYQVEEDLENYGIPWQETPKEDNNNLLAQEKENLDNTCILDNNTVVIHLKKRVEDRHDNSKPARDLE